MSIRSTAKALIVSDGKVLLNQCHDSKNGDYYSMPGGGQEKYETLHEAVIRECLEETGYEVKPLTLAGVCEEICMDMKFREKFPEYSHKMIHIFICELASDTAKAPTEVDSMQVSSEWIDIEALPSIRLLPKSLGEQVLDVLQGTAPFFLGSEHIDYNHG